VHHRKSGHPHGTGCIYCIQTDSPFNSKSHSGLTWTSRRIEFELAQRGVFCARARLTWTSTPLAFSRKRAIGSLVPDFGATSNELMPANAALRSWARGRSRHPPSGGLDETPFAVSTLAVPSLQRTSPNGCRQKARTVVDDYGYVLRRGRTRRGYRRNRRVLRVGTFSAISELLTGKCHANGA
jgi:hypothetical protein